MNETLIHILAVIGAITVLFLLIKVSVSFSLIGYAITAKVSNAPISILELFLMKLRKADIHEIVNSYIILKKINVSVTVHELEVANLAGKDIKEITKALIIANKEGIEMSFKEASTTSSIQSRMPEQSVLNRHKC